MFSLADSRIDIQVYIFGELIIMVISDFVIMMWVDVRMLMNDLVGNLMYKVQNQCLDDM